ncbi:unnamed protein product [Calypogeia fissa]
MHEGVMYHHAGFMEGREFRPWSSSPSGLHWWYGVKRWQLQPSSGSFRGGFRGQSVRATKGTVVRATHGLCLSLGAWKGGIVPKERVQRECDGDLTWLTGLAWQAGWELGADEYSTFVSCCAIDGVLCHEKS